MAESRWHCHVRHASKRTASVPQEAWPRIPVNRRTPGTAAGWEEQQMRAGNAAAPPRSAVVAGVGVAALGGVMAIAAPAAPAPAHRAAVVTAYVISDGHVVPIDT